MPKVIENFVLEEKIGKGQFGCVYRGVNQKTGQVVAAKAILRHTIKGKLYELLENQIQVLKTCDNPFIIKLYDFKKTPNNYYLMLEYCNQGDMNMRLEAHRMHIPEQECIRFFCQILKGFQTLVHHKIMHRDFKLANILLHEGNVKIADFGFAKLFDNKCDYAETMLGSPLNMAPEVLGGNKYNSKADIWSIGVCIYQMLFGEVPYLASTPIDLLKLIKNKPLLFPKEPPICEPLKDVLRRMLVADVKKRISWADLFEHPITTQPRLRLNKIDLDIIDNESLMISACRPMEGLPRLDSKPSRIDDRPPDNFSEVCRENTRRLLHIRNSYTFLASVGDEVIQHSQNEFNEAASYVLVQKILHMIRSIQTEISGQSERSILEYRQQYRNEPECEEIKQYIDNEHQVFQLFNDSLEPLLQRRKCGEGLKEQLHGGFDDQVYHQYLGLYLKERVKQATERAFLDRQVRIQEWRKIMLGCVALQIEREFAGEDFRFKQFYTQAETMTPEHTLLRIESLLNDCL